MVKKIPKALKEQVWVQFMGKKFENKCYITWCENIINVYDFHVGHNIPDSKGGETTLQNLRPICSRCNHSMSNSYTIDDWIKFGTKIIDTGNIQSNEDIPKGNEEIPITNNSCFLFSCFKN